MQNCSGRLTSYLDRTIQLLSETLQYKPFSFRRDRSLPCTGTASWFVPSRGYRSWPMISNFHREHLPMGLCSGRGCLLLVGRLFESPQYHINLVSSRNEHVCLCHSKTRGGSWCDKWKVLSAFAFNWPQTGHKVRINDYIVPDWLHVPIIVQCQSDACSLSSNDGAAVWQSFVLVAASCPTILEMAVDDCRRPTLGKIIAIKPQI